MTPPPGGETINGNERIGWDQPAADTVELATIRYAIYVDGTRTEASGVTCMTTSTAAGFACSGRLPPLTPGAHTLQLASFVIDGGVLESPRSAALPVTVVAAAVDQRSATASAERERGGQSALVRRTSPASPNEGGRASAARVVEVDTVVDATDLAFAPDGRLFIAERAGTVRVVRGIRVDAAGLRPLEPANRGRQAPDASELSRLHLPERAELLALAIDPQFGASRFVFAIYSERRGDAATFTLGRFREAGGVLADEAVLLDRIPASAPPHAALRFSGDGTLYAAFDAGGDARRSNDPASYNGKVLRLRTDGTTPRDQPSSTPVVGGGLFAPVGLAWTAGARDPWAVDRLADGSVQLVEVGGNHRAYRLPDGFSASSVTGAPDGNLLIGSSDTGALLRVRFDDAQPISTEQVELTELDDVRALTLAPDGALYLATPTRIWRVGAER